MTNFAAEIAEIFASRKHDVHFSYRVRDEFSNGYWDAWRDLSDGDKAEYGSTSESPLDAPDFVREWVETELDNVPENHIDLIWEYSRSEARKLLKLFGEKDTDPVSGKKGWVWRGDWYPAKG